MSYTVYGPCVVVFSDWAGLPAYEVLQEGQKWYEGAMEYFMGTFETVEEALRFIGSKK